MTSCWFITRALVFREHLDRIGLGEEEPDSYETGRLKLLELQDALGAR